LKAAWGALGFILTLCLIKVNFGLAALAVCVITIGVCDLVCRIPVNTAKKYFYAAAFIGLPLLVFIIYWSLLHGLTAMEIRQCLPYKEGDQPYDMSPLAAIGTFLKVTWQSITSSFINASFAVIVYASAMRCFYLFVKNKLLGSRKTIFALSLGMLCLFFVANFHEYLKSGVWYRSFWSEPLSMMIAFLLIDTAAQSIPKIAKKMIFTIIASLVVIFWFSLLGKINASKTDSQYLSLPKGNIYITNSSTWIVTVEETTAFLNKTLKPNELFFALPYDCLYYYLTEKRTPTRQLIFFQHIKIPAEQERSVIAELEKNHVNYVLLSNRAFATQEFGLGVLGKDYCPLIWNYIQANFVPVARFGDWSDEPGWAWNHGTLILKRKP
jgi:hypothetical protein